MSTHEYHLPYGKTQQSLTISSRCDLILPQEAEPAANPAAVITAALDQSKDVDLTRLAQAATVAIAVNDKTRPVPHETILPPLLEWLHARGVPASAIKFWIATGSHMPMSASEFSAILPPAIIARYAIESHDINDLANLVQLGVTSRGTPVIVNRKFWQADFKIVVGDIEPHHFAGFSGGYKTAAIGLAGRETINHNHAMLVHPDSWIGVYEPNPLRQDINEAGRMIQVDLALNTILTAHKKVVAAVSGSPDWVMEKGIPISRAVCGTPISEKYAIVVASAGGHPKDINFYQAQKALTHASLFCEQGGTIILAAACPEGSGSQGYEDFMNGVNSLSEVFEKFSRLGFKVGPHKAFQVARLLENYRIILVSQIPAALVKSLLMEPASTVQEAVDRALAIQRGSCSVAVLPHATTTLPFVAEKPRSETGYNK